MFNTTKLNEAILADRKKRHEDNAKPTIKKPTSKKKSIIPTKTKKEKKEES